MSVSSQSGSFMENPSKKLFSIIFSIVGENIINKTIEITSSIDRMNKMLFTEILPKIKLGRNM